MSIFTIKLLLLLAILAAGWLGGLPPLFAGLRGGKFQSAGNAFAAGIFVGVGLIHLLAEAHQAWTDLGWNYPVAYLLAAVAFAGVLLFEHVLLPEPAHAMVHDHTGASLVEREMKAVSRSVYPYFLVVALSIHSAVAGVALGSQDEFPRILTLFIAIVAHKSTAGFALGVSLARGGVPKGRAHGLVAVFALMTPLGIAAGMAVSGLLESRIEQYFDAMLLALAAGTFIYIASLDIIQDEFMRPGSRFVKWLWTVLGLVAMAVLAAWV